MDPNIDQEFVTFYFKGSLIADKRKATMRLSDIKSGVILCLSIYLSFKLVPFESGLDAVFYSPPVVTMALSCIISEIK